MPRLAAPIDAPVRDVAPRPPLHVPSARTAVEIDGVRRVYGDVTAVDGISLDVPAGVLHAVLGPNGAGKTTLLRLLTGLVQPTSGRMRLLGIDPAASPRALRRLIGLVPSGDRSFYLRISALENLVFYGRLYGYRRREAVWRAERALAAVDLLDAASRPVGNFSHGMHKRLSVARALLHEPRVLLVDEATHDLDPLAARRVRELVRAAADGGAAVLWATQRVEEVRGFADAVTVLDRGRGRFTGSVSQLVAFSKPRRYLVRLRADGGRLPDDDDLRSAELRSGASLAPVDATDGSYVLTLTAEATLGAAVVALHQGGAEVLHCTELESNVEEAFLAIVEGGR